MKTETLHQLTFTIVGFHVLASSLVIAALALYVRPSLLHHLMSTFLGLLTAFIDLHTDEVIVTLFLLVAFGFFLGFAAPTKPWRWALLIAMWIPLSNLLKAAMENHGGDMVKSGLLAVAALPALAGAYTGRLVYASSRKRVAEETRRE